MVLERNSRRPVRIRPMREADVPAAYRIERQAYPLPWPPSLFRRLLRGHRTQCRIMEAEGRPIGYGIYRLQGRWAHLLNLAIDSRCRRRGLGRQLLLHLLAELRAQGARGIWLEVRAASRPARRLYHQTGFRRTGRRRHYYRETPVQDAVVMIRRL